MRLLSLSPLMVALLAVGACKSEPRREVADDPPTEPAQPDPPATPEPEPEPEPDFDNEVSELGVGPLALEVRACTSDEDCVTSCQVDGDCCPQLCRCTRVYNREFARKLAAHQHAGCESALCPKAKCREPDREFYAVCEAGQCALKSRSLK